MKTFPFSAPTHSRMYWINGVDAVIDRPECHPDLSASLFFCVKYLPETGMVTWVKSLLKIPSISFRAHFLAWLVAVHEVRSSITKDSDFSFGAIEDAKCEIGFEHDFLLVNRRDEAIDRWGSPRVSQESFIQGSWDAFFSCIQNDLTVGDLNIWRQEFVTHRAFKQLSEKFSLFEYVRETVLR